jgi:hypothetical protein
MSLSTGLEPIFGHHTFFEAFQFIHDVRRQRLGSTQAYARNDAGLIKPAPFEFLTAHGPILPTARQRTRASQLPPEAADTLPLPLALALGAANDSARVRCNACQRGLRNVD